MIFFRRHWPDLIIVLLIAVLLGGFAFVLLNGQTRLGTGASVPAPPSEAQNAPSATGAPPENQPQSQPENQPNVQAAVPGTAAAPPAAVNTPEELPTIAGQGDATAVPPVVVTPSVKPPSDQAPPTTGSDVAVTPTGPVQVPVQTPAQEAQGDPVVVEPTPASPAQTGPAQTDAVQPPAQPSPDQPSPDQTGPVPTSSADTPTRADYRLSVGTFASEAGARAATRAIAGRGYTVHVIPIPGGVVAQIGPFANRETAAKALDDVRRVFSNVALYAPVTKASPPNTQKTEPQNGATPVSSPAAAPASYLQVGAFSRERSAAPLVEQLRAEGFSPTVNAPPGKKVRVLVGPYGPSRIERAERKLSGMGLDHFRVR